MTHNVPNCIGTRCMHYSHHVTTNVCCNRSRVFFYHILFEDMANLSETRTSTEQLKASGSSTKGIILLENVYRAVVYEGISFCTPIEHKIFVFMICALKLRLQTAKRNAIVNSLASEWHGLYMHLLYNNSENPIEWKRQQYPN